MPAEHSLCSSGQTALVQLHKTRGKKQTRRGRAGARREGGRRRETEMRVLQEEVEEGRVMSGVPLFLQKVPA